MVIKLQEISILEIKLTTLQENILIELNKTFNTSFICKKMSIKPITLSKTIQALTNNNLIEDNNLTDKGKKMVHYLEFRNETISLFLKKHKIEQSNEITNQLSKLDYKVIIAIRNLI